MKKILALSLFAMLIAVGIGSAFTNWVNTTNDYSVTAGTDRVITPENMTNIHSGMYVYYDGFNGLATGEYVLVKSATGTTFTIDLAHDHAAYAQISNDPRRSCVMWGT